MEVDELVIEPVGIKGSQNVTDGQFLLVQSSHLVLGGLEIDLLFGLQVLGIDPIISDKELLSLGG
jgi:hypothetical protein